MALEAFRAARVSRVLELGAGQGRDALFFARSGLSVCALDFTTTAVETIGERAVAAGVADRVRPVLRDVREPLPFPDESFDACYSYMLFCMALTESDLRSLAAEIWRVLRPGGLCVYTARTIEDPDFGRGVHHGEAMYELDRFVVHFFSSETVERLADRFAIARVERFEEGELPRRLFRVTLEKPAVSAIVSSA